jgi:membrane-bound lytic murein transglycosylase F
MSEHTFRKLGETSERDSLMAPPVADDAIPKQGEDFPGDTEAVRILRSYGSTIKSYSAEYGFDWRLILAIMKQESRFVPHAESHKGAAGLMQIMPATSVDVARVLEIKDMTHPKNNIRGGIYYLRWLYDLFGDAEEGDRIKLTLAAYNAGVRRVYDAQDVAAYLDEDPTTWLAVRDALPLLSKRYYTLHRNVWPQEKPNAGWFGNSRETVRYVENIMEYYDEYRLLFN